MHTNDKKYKLLSDGEKLTPSVIGVIPYQNHGLPEIREKLCSYSFNNNILILSVDDAHLADTCNKRGYTVTLEYERNIYTIQISIVKTDNINFQDFGLDDMIDEGEFLSAITSTEYIEIRMMFGKNPLKSFHCQLQLSYSLIPDAWMVIDCATYRVLPRKWLKLAAKSKTPPSPDYLYSLHAVYEEKEGYRNYWFKTHGLLRCGFVDLEILNIRSGEQQMYDLINNVVKRFLYNPPLENEKFTIGFDGLQINLTWIRWERALAYFSENILGGDEDRYSDEIKHPDPSGILFAIEDGNLISPEIYARALSNNPILFISEEETCRMGSLARERYPFFFDLFSKFLATRNPSFLKKLVNNTRLKPKEDWFFWAKIGLIIDDAKNETEKEHLWFTVIDAGECNIRCQLINDPYWISNIYKGDIRTFPTEMITDWLIADKDGNQYTPDSIYQLLD